MRVNSLVHTRTNECAKLHCANKAVCTHRGELPAMTEMLFPFLLIIGYFVLMRFVLPKMGVPT